MDGQTLHFHLVGINNQNFIMEDEETGTWWQQVSGEAIQGPLEGKRLEGVPWDEVSFGIWKREHPDTLVLRPDEDYESRYLRRDWDAQMGDVPTVVSVDPEDGLGPRSLVVGVAVGQKAKAYPIEALLAQSPVADGIGSTPLLLVVGADGQSVRCFDRTVDGQALDLFLKAPPPHEAANADSAGEDKPPVAETEPPASENEPRAPQSETPAPATSPDAKLAPIVLIDAQTGSEWDFSGTAIAGPLQGKRLERIQTLKDYWFDWKLYHPDTVVYRAGTLPRQPGATGRN